MSLKNMLTDWPSPLKSMRTLPYICVDCKERPDQHRERRTYYLISSGDSIQYSDKKKNQHKKNEHLCKIKNPAKKRPPVQKINLLAKK